MKREPFKPGEHEYCSWSIGGGNEQVRAEEFQRQKVRMARLGYVVHAAEDARGILAATFRRTDVQPDPDL